MFHKLMLNDRAQLSAYRKAVEDGLSQSNAGVFKDDDTPRPSDLGLGAAPTHTPAVDSTHVPGDSPHVPRQHHRQPARVGNAGTRRSAADTWRPCDVVES